MNNGQGPDEAAEFDRLMALDEGALSADEKGQQVQADATPPAPAADATPAGEVVAGSGGQDAPGSEGEGGGSSTAAPGATDVSTDWVSSLPADVQARIKEEREQLQRDKQAAEDRYQALHGRLAPTQQALSEAQRQLAQRQQVVAQPATAPVQQDGQSLDSYFDSDDWKRWADDFPGDAKVLRAGLESQQQAWVGRLTGLEQRIVQLSQRLESTEQVASRTVVKDEIAWLKEQHPDWEQVNQSDEFWAWFNNDWRTKQPKSVRGMYYDEATLDMLWNDAEFAAERITDYKASRQAAPAPVVVPDPTPPANSTQPAPVPARNPRLSMSVAPDVRGGPPATQAVPLDSMEPGEAFDYVWNNTP